MAKLLEQRYGKEQVRVLKILREGPRHTIREIEVSALLAGDFESSYTAGDNSKVVLTDTITAHAGIGEKVTFVGQGYKFQIWEPERFAAYREEAKNRLRDLRKRLVPGHRATGASPRTGES